MVFVETRPEDAERPLDQPPAFLSLSQLLAKHPQVPETNGHFGMGGAERRLVDLERAAISS